MFFSKIKIKYLYYYYLQYWKSFVAYDHTHLNFCATESFSSLVDIWKPNVFIDTHESVNQLVLYDYCSSVQLFQKLK